MTVLPTHGYNAQELWSRKILLFSVTANITRDEKNKIARKKKEIGLVEMTKNVSSKERGLHLGRTKTFALAASLIFAFSAFAFPVAREVSAEEVDKSKEDERVEEQEQESQNVFAVHEMTDEHKDLIIRSVISEEEELRLAKMVYGEDRQNSLMERSATIWCAFNRADAWEKSISSVVVTNQFHGYFPSQKSPEWAVELVRDVALRYGLEGLGYEDVGRTLPSDYLYFSGSGGSNRFRSTYSSKSYWDWDAVDPYDGEYDMMDYLE